MSAYSWTCAKGEASADVAVQPPWFFFLGGKGREPSRRIVDLDKTPKAAPRVRSIDLPGGVSSSKCSAWGWRNAVAGGGGKDRTRGAQDRFPDAHALAAVASSDAQRSVVGSVSTAAPIARPLLPRRNTEFRAKLIDISVKVVPRLPLNTQIAVDRCTSNQTPSEALGIKLHL